MSEQRTPAQGSQHERIAALAAQVASQTPGVLRLEPTVQGLLASFGSARWPGASPHGAAAQGVNVTASGDTLHVHLDLATDVSYVGVSVAEQARQRVATALGDAGIAVADVDVSILAVEPASPQ